MIQLQNIHVIFYRFSVMGRQVGGWAGDRKKFVQAVLQEVETW